MTAVRRTVGLRVLTCLGGAVIVAVMATLWIQRLLPSGPTARADARLIVVLHADTNSIAQVFFDLGEGFNERDSARALVFAGAARELEFLLPGRVVRAMRFDPLSSTGTVDILSWRLEASDGGGRMELPVRGLRPVHHIAAAEWREDRLHVEVAAGADDPQLLFAPDEPLVMPTSRFPWWSMVLSSAGVAMLVGARAAWRADVPIWPTWAVALVLAGVAVFMLYPVHRVLDLPLWDEANYLGWGRAFWTTQDLGGVSGAPVYLLWYALATAVVSGGGAVFATHYVLKVAIVVLVGVLAARWFESPWAGLCAGVATAISAWNLSFPLLVYQAAWIWLLLAIVVADRSRLGALGFLALAALTRLEYVFALGVFAAVTLVAQMRGWTTRGVPRLPVRWGWTWSLPVIVVIFVAGHVSGWNPGTARGWFAFQQHYALGRYETGQERDFDPWIEYDRVMQRDFPGAISLSQAHAVNAPAVRGHVRRNVALVPARVAEFFVSTAGGAAGWLIGWGGVALSVSVAVFAGGSASAGVGAFVRRHRWSVFTAGCGAVAVAPGIIVYAKTAYLLPIVPIVWLGAAMLAHGIRTRLRRVRPPGLAWAAALLGVAAAAVAATPRPYARAASVRPVHETVELIRALRSNGATILGLSSSSYAHYLGPTYRAIEPLASVGGPSDTSEMRLLPMVEKHRPDMILVTASWRALHSFDAEGLRAVEARGWRAVPLADGTLWLAPEASTTGD